VISSCPSYAFQPTATLANLRLRSHIIHTIRHFFAERNVLEVDTPLLCRSTTTDPHINSFTVDQTWYLQTSPEFAMKRLLAAGSGCIYQISKAFRKEEQGRHHNPEFTILEWYRVGFDHHSLMDEVDSLLQLILQTRPAIRLSYEAIFQAYLQISPHDATIAQLQRCAQDQGLHEMENIHQNDRDFWLYLLMSHCIEPHLGNKQPIFITDFPSSQAALSKIRQGKNPVAERFELYFKGIELANGYHELTDPMEQRQRFNNNNVERARLGLAAIPIDEYVLAALEEGMPTCAGVALGIDRLVMLAANARSINEVMSFISANV
jgi:elongation factor P--(R)-beta-lysine ligase